MNCIHFVTQIRFVLIFRLIAIIVTLIRFNTLADAKGVQPPLAT
ncbi:protein of unknown function [Aminobacter niigataensis]|nr:protein of unknown function [Aminobacter niigataensis]